jgi:hypothetical protein
VSQQGQKLLPLPGIEPRTSRLLPAAVVSELIRIRKVTQSDVLQ